MHTHTHKYAHTCMCKCTTYLALFLFCMGVHACLSCGGWFAASGAPCDEGEWWGTSVGSIECAHMLASSSMMGCEHACMCVSLSVHKVYDGLQICVRERECVCVLCILVSVGSDATLLVGIFLLLLWLQRRVHKRCVAFHKRCVAWSAQRWANRYWWRILTMMPYHSSWWHITAMDINTHTYTQFLVTYSNYDAVSQSLMTYHSHGHTYTYIHTVLGDVF